MSVLISQLVSLLCILKHKTATAKDFYSWMYDKGRQDEFYQCQKNILYIKKQKKKKKLDYSNFAVRPTQILWEFTSNIQQQ